MKAHFVLLTSFGILLFFGEGSAQTQRDLNAQALADFTIADKQLTLTYQKLLDTLDAPGREKLIQSQNAWVKYRDAQAALEADQVRGGSAAASILDATRGHLTRERTEQLKKMLQ
jgi:uncharacterized protein YecT (DUF1311 family)